MNSPYALCYHGLSGISQEDLTIVSQRIAEAINKRGSLDMRRDRTERTYNKVNKVSYEYLSMESAKRSRKTSYSTPLSAILS